MDQTGLKDGTYNYLRKQFDEFLDNVLTKMREDGAEEATMGCQLGIFSVNRLTSIVSLIDKPDIAPENQNKYDIGCRVIKDVVESKGFTLLEF